MLHTPRALRGAVVAPHHLAAQSGLAVLREGGNAVEAAVAAAAAMAVVYPHMNGIGGDNFWLLAAPGGPVLGIDACGAAAAAATPEAYRARGFEAIPTRGPLAANTVAGAVSGWQAALSIAAQWGGRLPLSRLLADAIHYAEAGAPVTASQHADTAAKAAELAGVPGFAATFLSDDGAPPVGARFRQPALAATLRRLAEAGLDDFYRGETARAMAAELAAVGSPLGAADLARHRAAEVRPLSLRLAAGTAYNMPPPTQGLASLLILGIFERLGCGEAEGFDHLHGLIEATKEAFRVRDAYVTDPAYMTVAAESFLEPKAIAAMAARIEPTRAAPWQPGAGPGDTVWLGAIDAEGRAVSVIQSIYWEFGSAVVLADSGVLWQNRGTSFALAEGAHNRLAPGRKPFHTIQPALARLDDGRTLVYGTMGGDGQPQTQAAVYTRHVSFGQPLQRAITAPRWLLGRTWGAESANLRIENRVDPGVIAALEAAGHEVARVGAFDPVMGHAGAVAHHPDGLIEGAADPRGDGVVAAF